MGEFMKLVPPDAHPDLIFAKMCETIGEPPLMLVDFRPINKPTILVTDHEIMEQISKASKKYPASVPKIDFSHFRPLLDDTSILAVDYDEWKPLRQRFSPGFAPQHLLTLLPAILEEANDFIAILDDYAKTGQGFPLMNLIMNLTFDVIGAVAIGVKLNSQSKDHPGELIQLFQQLLKTYLDDKADLPWWVVPHVALKRKIYGKRIDRIIHSIIRDKWSEWKKSSSSSFSNTKDRSILSLSFQEHAGADKKTLSPAEVTSTSDQLKTFLLAGHDTTSTAVSWIIYELSLSPRVLSLVRDELVSIFGGSISNREHIKSYLLANPTLLNEMKYSSLVIRETLRLHPPTGSARTSYSNFTVTTPDGIEHNLDDAIIYMCNAIAQRDTSVYGKDAHEFRPERWTSEEAKNYPASAYRPFERGPRGCIGQEFAMIEIKTILAIGVGRYDFVKVGLGEPELELSGNAVMGEDGRLKVRARLMVLGIQSAITPRGGCYVTPEHKPLKAVGIDVGSTQCETLLQMQDNQPLTPTSSTSSCSLMIPSDCVYPKGDSRISEVPFVTKGNARYL
ncbi:cytochrome P450 [Cladorrhinum sp. PSN259]|nr:cytochrome P450 [Cladorrhinum sp. PSN259]